MTNKTIKQVLEDELELLKNSYARTLKSSLTAGLLLIPDGLQCWNKDTDEEPDDFFIEDLSDALIEQTRGDIDTVSTYLPFIIRGPSDLLKEVRLLKFGDAHLLEVLQDRIDVVENRLALIDEPVVH